MKGNKKKPRIPVRLPLPKKPGGPMGPPKGDKGYDRKKEREDLEWEIEQSEHDPEKKNPDG